MIDHPTELAPGAVITSGLTLAGLGEFGILEALPKGAIFMLVSGMFGLILFFVKRDYSRINEGLERSSKQAAELRALIEKNHNDVMLQVADCIKVKDFSPSMDRVWSKLNRVDNRVIILETKSGMHDHIELESSLEAEQEDGKGET